MTIPSTISRPVWSIGGVGIGAGGTVGTAGFNLRVESNTYATSRAIMKMRAIIAVELQG